MDTYNTVSKRKSACICICNTYIESISQLPNPLPLSLPPLRRAIQLVRFEKSAEGSSYGIPTENEIRLLLIESKGDIVKAKNRCVKNRKEKVSVLVHI